QIALDSNVNEPDSSIDSANFHRISASCTDAFGDSDGNQALPISGALLVNPYKYTDSQEKRS
ncbi:MAG: hypothetical protein JSW21_00215, partial [Gammaproteobacteria bacterium]